MSASVSAPERTPTDAGAINRPDYDGRAAPYLAASEGTSAAVQLDPGADPALVDRWGSTPLDDARRGAHDAIVLMLARGRRSRRAGKAV